MNDAASFGGRPGRSTARMEEPSATTVLCWSTLNAMLRDRGYHQEAVPEQKTTSITAVFVHPETADRIQVHQFSEPKIGIAHVKNFVQPEHCHYIFVSEGGLTPKARKACENYFLHSVRIEVFTVPELLYNVTKHVYCPKHRLCSSVEKADVLQKLGVKEDEAVDKLPSILKNDPVMRYYGALEGTLIEITRGSFTMPGFPEVSYRLVVAPD